MKTLRLMILMVLAVSISGCNRDLEEGDKNTYTWKGRLVKDCSSTPVANEHMYLEIEYPLSYEIIAECTTDDDGYYSLTYKKIDDNLGVPVKLYSESSEQPSNILMTGPVNQSIDRDISIRSCNQFFLESSTKYENDSIYILLGKPLDNTPFFMTTVPGSDPNYEYAVISLHTQDLAGLGVVKTESFTARLWDNQPIDLKYTLAANKKDIIKAMQANLIDSVDFPGHTFDFSIRGYPMIDTVKIELPE